jgi:hypothetical protein
MNVLIPFSLSGSLFTISGINNPTGTFFIPHHSMGNYDFSYKGSVRVGRCDPAGPDLCVFRLHVLTKSANNHTCNPDYGGGIELGHDQKF